MARRKNISEEAILKAKAWLANGGTKRGACDILEVSNNKTMEARIEEYDRSIRIDKELRAKKRKEAVSPSELAEIITDHLRGYSLQQLSDVYYRSINVIKHHLHKSGAFMHDHKKIDPLNPPMLPEECVSQQFDIGEYVWSAKYGCIAKVMAEYGNAYRIRVWGDGIMEYAYQSPYELGRLKHLEKLGVKLEKLIPDAMSSEEIAFQINKTLLEANKKGRAQQTGGF